MQASMKNADVNGLLQEYLVVPLVDMFNDIYAEVKRGDDRIATFQRRLKEIPKWKTHIEVAHCVDKLEQQCGFLKELITALYLYHIKGIATLQNTSVNNVRLHLPSKAEFVQNIMILMAKGFYESPMMFRTEDRDRKLAVGYRAVDTYISKSLPVKAILDAYIASSVEPHDNKNVVVLREENAPGAAMLTQIKSQLDALETNIVSNLQTNNNRNSIARQKPATASVAPSTKEATSDVGTLSTKKQDTEETTIETVAQDSVADVRTIVKSATPQESKSDAALSLNILPEVHAVPKQAPAKEKEAKLNDNVKDMQKSNKSHNNSISDLTESKASEEARVMTNKATRGRGSKKTNGVSPEKQSVSTSSLTRKQQKDLLDEILKYTRTKEMVTPSFFSDADSKEEK